jgi:hypothetical protein
MANIGIVIDIRSVATVLPSFVLFFNGSEIPIFVYVVRENQVPREIIVPEVGCSLRGDGADVYALGGNLQRSLRRGSCVVTALAIMSEDVEVVLLAFDDMRESSVSEPEDFATFGELSVEMSTRKKRAQLKHVQGSRRMRR